MTTLVSYDSLGNSHTYKNSHTSTEIGKHQKHTTHSILDCVTGSYYSQTPISFSTVCSTEETYLLDLQERQNRPIKNTHPHNNSLPLSKE